MQVKLLPPKQLSLHGDNLHCS